MADETKWHRDDNGSILLYTLKQHGWRKGQPIMVNDLTIRIENANGSTHDLNAVADKLLAALNGKGAQGDVAEAAMALLPISMDRSAYPEINLIVMRAMQGSAGTIPKFWSGFSAALRAIAGGCHV